MKILITGGSGFIGQNYINFLLKQNHKIINIDIVKSSLSHRNLKTYICDYRDEKNVNKLVYNKKIKIAYHFASKTLVSEKSTNDFEYFDINSFGIASLLPILKKNKIKLFFFSSSAAVYGNTKFGSKLKENDKLNPISKYGLSKVFAEKIISNQCKNLGIKFFIARYFNVIGSNIFSNIEFATKFESVIYHLKNSAMNGKNFYIKGQNLNTADGSAYRDYVDIRDVVAFNYRALKYLSKNHSEIINCGSSKSYSVKQLVSKFSKINNVNIKIKFKNISPDEIIYSKSDITKANKCLNWSPQYKLLNNILSK